MEKTEDIIFKPEVVPNKNWVKELDRRHMDSSFSSFRAPADDKRIITLCRPFVVLSKTTYSTPVTLPLGLAYLAGVLEKAGYKTKIIDAIGEDHPVKIRRSHDNKYNIQGLNSDEILEKIDPDTFIIGITLMFSLEWFAQRVLIEKIRKKFPNAIIVVGGEHASSVSEFTLRDCPSIDYVIKGEGEFSMLEFSHLMFNGRDVTNIPGLCFVNEKNQFVDNGLSKRIEHIDTLPRPAWHLLKPENYFIDNFAFGLSGGRNMPILATRGCPYQCTFCSSPSMWTTRYIMRKPEEIVDEIEWLKQKYQASSFEFFDLTAIIKRTWIFEFCAELKKRKLEDITWQLPVGTRSESLDKETLQALYDTGCRFIKYAPESGSEKSLAMIKKRVKIDRLNKSVKAANKIGHTTSLNFIIGFPHETVIDCLKTIFFGTYSAIRFGPYDINYAVFVPYPGSELFESLRKKKKIEINDKYFESLHMQFDITTTESYCENVSGKMLSFLRFLGFASSYSAIYLSRPKRIYMLIKNIFKDRFFANNLFEQRVYDVYRRYKLKKIKFECCDFSKNILKTSNGDVVCMKYTLITGGSGFIGSRIISKFNKNKIQINLKRKKNNTFFKNHNIINLDFSKKNLNFGFLKNINTVIHCASLNKFESEKEPKKAKLVNYDFLEKFIDNCKKNKIKRFIKISTSKVYGNVLNKKISERSPLAPFDKYTEYHAKSDLLLNKLAKNSYLDIIVLRVSNGYGYPSLNNPNCWDLIVNNFCYQAHFKKEIKVKSNIDYIKNYIDMEYLVNVIEFFNHYSGKINGIFNVGSKNNLSFLDIAKKIKIVAKKNKLNNIKIFTDFKQTETNNNFSYDIKKMLDLGCLIKENRNNEINNLFKYLKDYARKV